MDEWESTRLNQEVWHGQRNAPMLDLTPALAVTPALAGAPKASVTEEPGAEKLHAGVCTGAPGNRRSYLERQPQIVT